MSTPCRVVAWIVKQFALPDLNSPDCLRVNPIHSLPFLVNYAADGTETGINGSEAI
eukprot:gene25972-9672_t